MQRRSFLGMAGLSAAAFVLHPGRAIAGRGARRPNIIYILADDLGYGHLGCFGQKEIKTPVIDKMAREGMKFTDHYAGSALCAPSRCVLMTGLHTGHCFIRNNRPLPVEGNVPIPADSQTIPKLLKKAGYKSGAMGKWGLGYPGSEGDPIKQGFDHFFGYNCQRQAHTYYPPHLWRNDKKVMLEGNEQEPKTDYSHDLLTTEALNFISDNRENPFFLYVPYTIPHAAFQVPELGQYAEKPWSPVKKAIAAMISRMDGDVGKILDLIKSLGLEENTLVIFASDNGCAGGALLNEFNGSGPLRASKGTLYEGGIRSPMIACWLGKITPGTTSAHICAFQDMMPTFAELAGVKVTGRTDGISIVPTLLGKDRQQRHEYLYWELRDNRAVRMGNFKAVRNKAGLQLFDLAKDLSEKTDVAAKRPDVIERMRKIIQDSHEDSPFFTWEYTGPIPEKPATKKTRKRRTGRN